MICALFLCLVYAGTTLAVTAWLLFSCWRQRRSAALQVSRRLVYATLLLWVPVVIRLTVPCPIQGDYFGNMTACKCDEYRDVVRFAGGQASFSEHGSHKQWGRYQKTGWNTYVLREDDAEEFPVTLRTGWLLMTITYAPMSRHFNKRDELVRDFFPLRWIP